MTFTHWGKFAWPMTTLLNMRPMKSSWREKVIRSCAKECSFAAVSFVPIQNQTCNQDFVWVKEVVLIQEFARVKGGSESNVLHLYALMGRNVIIGTNRYKWATSEVHASYKLAFLSIRAYKCSTFLSLPSLSWSQELGPPHTKSWLQVWS